MTQYMYKQIKYYLKRFVAAKDIATLLMVPIEDVKAVKIHLLLKGE